MRQEIGIVLAVVCALGIVVTTGCVKKEMVVGSAVSAVVGSALSWAGGEFNVKKNLKKHVFVNHFKRSFLHGSSKCCDHETTEADLSNT